MGNAADLPLAIEGPVPPSLPAVSVDLTVTPVLSSALARSALPVVPRLTLTSDDADLRGATLRLSVHDAEGEIGAPVHRLVDLDAGRTTVLGDPGLALDPDTLLRVRERRAGWVRVELEAAGELLVQRPGPGAGVPPRHRLGPPPPRG